MYTFIFLQNGTNVISLKTPHVVNKKKASLFSPLLIFFPLLLLKIMPIVLCMRDKYSTTELYSWTIMGL